MKFGVFDHMDRAGGSLTEQYETRLKLTGAYDAAGFHMYHVAEHHSTSLGMAPSPSVFLAAVAQRTKRLHFGPLVYPIALYHPLRLAEEICMLDHMSGGRFEFGIGKGASQHELAIFGVAPPDAEPRFQESLAVLMQALTQDRVDFDGKYYRCRDVPIEMHPLRRPHPPIWYGLSNPASAARVAKLGYNVVTNSTADRAKPIFDAFRASWAETGKPVAKQPLMGLGRFVVLAPDGQEAKAIATRAFPKWEASFWKLWDMRGARPPVPLPEVYAGTPNEVLETLAAHIKDSGATYLLSRFAFGDVSLQEAMRSIELVRARPHARPCLFIARHGLTRPSRAKAYEYSSPR